MSDIVEHHGGFFSSAKPAEAGSYSNKMDHGVALAAAFKEAEAEIVRAIRGPVSLQPIPPTIVPPSMLPAILREELDCERRRANTLADECGRLNDENTELHARVSRLEREIERLNRKVLG